MEASFLYRLEKLRKRLGMPLIVTSAYRCADHNAKVSKTGKTGPHTTGQAVDLLISGEDAYRIVKVATKLGFTGIGVSQKGTWSSRFIHVDDIAGIGRPRIWSY